jgi:hypothetical protein
VVLSTIFPPSAPLPAIFLSSAALSAKSVIFLPSVIFPPSVVFPLSVVFPPLVVFPSSAVLFPVMLEGKFYSCMSPLMF